MFDNDPIQGVKLSKEAAEAARRLNPNVNLLKDSNGDFYVPFRPIHPEAGATFDHSLPKEGKPQNQGLGDSSAESE
jgi:hypothetical protein